MPSATAPRRSRALALLPVGAVLLGVVLLTRGLLGQEEPPRAVSVGSVESAREPTAQAAPQRSTSSGPARRGRQPQKKPDSTNEPRPRKEPRPKKGPQPLPLSPPVSLRIPTLDVATPVNPIGTNADGTLAVPQPGSRLDQAAWFDRSPSPGQAGPSIIEGHVDTEQGPSVFYELAALRPGDEVEVTRRDGVVVTFTVDALREVRKSSFPTELVYGGDLSRATLRLITCSQFDPDIGTHVGNTVVFASVSEVERG